MVFIIAIIIGVVLAALATQYVRKHPETKNRWPRLTGAVAGTLAFALVMLVFDPNGETGSAPTARAPVATEAPTTRAPGIAVAQSAGAPDNPLPPPGVLDDGGPSGLDDPALASMPDMVATLASSPGFDAQAVAKLSPTIVGARRNAYGEPPITLITVHVKSGWSDATMVSDFANTAMRILREGIKANVLHATDAYRFLMRVDTTAGVPDNVLTARFDPSSMKALDLRPFATAPGQFLDVADTQASGGFGARVLKGFCTQHADDARLTCRRVAAAGAR